LKFISSNLLEVTVYYSNHSILYVLQEKTQKLLVSVRMFETLFKTK